jgi:hypothetical protein
VTDDKTRLVNSRKHLIETILRAERAEAILAEIRAWAERESPYVEGRDTGETRVANLVYNRAREHVFTLLDAAPTTPVTTVGPHPPDNDAFHTSSGLTPCPECDGRGSVLDAPARVLDGRAYVVPCPLCHGTGKTPKETL